MQVQTVDKPMCFKCDCGEQFLLAVWKLVKERDLLVVRYLNNHQQFAYCPFCGGKTAGMRMEVQP